MEKRLKLRRPVALLLALIMVLSLLPVLPGTTGLIPTAYADEEADDLPPSGTEGEGLSYNVKELLQYNDDGVTPNFDYVIDTTKLVVKEENVDNSHGPSFDYQSQQWWNNNSWYTISQTDTTYQKYSERLGRDVYYARVARDCVVWNGTVHAQTVNSSGNDYVDIHFPNAAKNVHTGERKDVTIRISNVRLAPGWKLQNGNLATSSDTTTATAICVCNFTYAESQTYYMNSEYYYNDDDELEVDGSLMLTNFVEYDKFETDQTWANRPMNGVSYDIEVMIDGAAENETCFARYGDIDTNYRAVYYGMSHGTLAYSDYIDFPEETLNAVYKNDYNWGHLTSEEYAAALEYFRINYLKNNYWSKNFPAAIPLTVETVKVMEGIVSPVYVTDTARLWKVKDDTGYYRTFSAGANDASTDRTAINFIGRADGYKIQWQGPSCATRLLDPPFPSIVLKKTSEDGNVSGITFDFYKKGASGYPSSPTFTATTDEEGYIRLTGDSGRSYLASSETFTYNNYLEFAATYKVVERVPAGYVVAGGSNEKEITLTIGDNEIEFENVISPTNVNVQKTFPAGVDATSSMLSGWTFTLEELSSTEAMRSGSYLMIRDNAVLDGGKDAIVRIEAHRTVNGVDTIVADYSPNECRIMTPDDAAWPSSYSSYSAYLQFRSGVIDSANTYIVYYKTPGRIVLTDTTGADGKVSFNNLENGKKWWLSETPRTGYVEKPGVFVSPVPRSTTTVEMENIPLTTLRVKKEIPAPSEGSVEGWMFVLERYSDYVEDGNTVLGEVSKPATKRSAREIYLNGVTEAYNIVVKRNGTVVTGWEQVYNTDATPGIHLRGINGEPVFSVGGTYYITYTPRERWTAITDENGYCEFTIPANTAMWLSEREVQGWIPVGGMMVDPVPYNNGSYIGIYAANSVTVQNHEETGWIRIVKEFAAGCENTNKAGWQFITCRDSSYTGNWFDTQTYIANASGTVLFSEGDVYKIYDGITELSGWTRSGDTIDLGYGNNAARNKGHLITIVYATSNAPSDYRSHILTTDASGSATGEQISNGSAVVEEIPRPGYVKQPSQTVIVYVDQVTSVTFTNTQLQLEITKQLIDPNMGSVRGWNFIVYTSNPDTDTSAYAMYSASSDVNGKALITGLPAGTYWVKEVAVDGWAIQPAVQVVVRNDNVIGNPATVTVVNSLSSGDLEIVKTDTSDEGNVEHIPFIVMPKSLVGSATKILDKHKHIATVSSNVVSFSATSYGIIAVYVNGVSVSFTQSTNNSARLDTAVDVGNTIEIVYKKANLDYEGYVYYTEADGHIEEHMTGGVYHVEEIPQPGYTVLPAQTAIVGGTETATVSFENTPQSEKASLQIEKQLAQGTEGTVSGWKFAILPIGDVPATSRPIYETTTVVTSWQRYVTIPGAVKIIAVYKDGAPLVGYTASGNRITLPLGTPEGTVLTVIYAKRNVSNFNIGTTNGTGIYTKFGIDPGQYYIEEIPQYGYQVQGRQYQIVTVEAGQLTTVTFVNRAKATTFQVVKSLEAGADGSTQGWVFHLQKAGTVTVEQSAKRTMVVTGIPAMQAGLLFIKGPDGAVIPQDQYTIVSNHPGRETWVYEIEFNCTDEEVVAGTYTVGYALSREVMTAETNRIGRATFTGLEPGASYWLTEETQYGWLPYEGAFVSPLPYNDGVYIDAFAVNSKAVTNHPNNGTLSLQKTVTPAGTASLEGWQFVEKATTNGSSVPSWFSTSNWVANGTTKTHSLSSTVAQEVYAVYANGVKMTEGTDYSVVGLTVQFETAPANGTLISIVHTTPEAPTLSDMIIHTTDTTGAFSDKVMAGEYMIEEIPVPGFAAQNDVPATIVRNETTSVQFTNRQLVARIRKVINTSGLTDPVYAEGDPTAWTMELYAKDPGADQNAVPITTTTAAANGGYAYFRGIPAGHYWVKEIAQDGWKVVNTIEIEVTNSNISTAPATGTITNYPLVLELTKVIPNSIGTETPWANDLATTSGWVCTVYKTNPDTDAQAEVVATVTTNSQGKGTIARIPAGTYWVKETAVTGWKTPAAVAVTVTNENTATNPATATIENIPLKLVITKQLVSGVEGSVQGWEFKIYDTNPNNSPEAVPIKTATTNANGLIEFTQVPAGTYWIAETLVDGWGEVDVTQVTVTNNNTIYNPVNAFIVNDPLELKIIKSIANGAEGSISGWEFKIYSVNPDTTPGAEPYAVLSSGTDGVAARTHIPAGTYWVKETPVAGWKEQPTKTITVTTENTTANPAEVYFENIPYALVIRKELNVTDGTSASLENWEFKLYNVDPVANPSATPIATLTTNESGQVQYTNLVPGTYWVKETNVTNWTEQAVAQVTVTEANTINNPAVVTFTNTPLPTSLRVKKELAAGSTGSVEGWTFFLQTYADYQENGAFVESTANVTTATAGTTLTLGSALNTKKVFSVVAANGTTYTNFSTATDLATGNTIITLDAEIPAGTYTVHYTNRENIYMATTDANGYAYFNNLPATITDYWLTEVQETGWLPFGGVRVTITPYNNGVYTGAFSSNSQTVTNTKDTGSAVITKRFAPGTTGTLEGWQFSVRPASEAQASDTWFTKTTIIANGGKTYTYTTANTGAPYQVYVNGLPVAPASVANGTITMAENVASGSIITVVDYTASGAGKTSSIFTTSAGGSASLTLDAGSYVVEEIPRPGYIAVANQTITVSNGNNAAVTFTNQQMLLQVEKQIAAGSEGSVEGWQFGIYAANPDTDPTAVLLGTITTNSSGLALSSAASGLVLEPGTYWVKETAVSGWAVLPAASVTVTEANTPDNPATVSFVNEQSSGHIGIQKEYTQGSTGPLDGWEFALLPQPANTFTGPIFGTFSFVFTNTSYVDNTDGFYTFTVSRFCTEAITGVYKVYSNGVLCEEAGLGMSAAQIKVRHQFQDGDLVTVVYMRNADVNPSDYSIVVTNAAGKAEADVELGALYIEEIPRPGFLQQPGQTVTVADSETTVTFLNEAVKPGIVTVEKENTYGTKVSGVGMRLEYTYDNGTTWHPIRTVNSGEATSANPYPIGTSTTTGITDGVLVTSNAGVVTFSGLNTGYGIRYRVIEAYVPSGLSLLKDPVNVGELPEVKTFASETELNAFVTAYRQKNPNAAELVVDTNALTVYIYHLYARFVNMGVSYPPTGGHGTPYIPFAFIALALVCVAGYCIRKKRKILS